MHHVLRHVMRKGEIIAPGATIEDLSPDEVENLMRSASIESGAAREARLRVVDIRTKAEAEAKAVLDRAESEAALEAATRPAPVVAKSKRH